MDFLIQYKWPILLGLEVLAWGATFFTLYARYRMQSKVWFQIGTAMLVMTGFIPQILLGIMNYLSVGEIDLFTFCIVALVVYGATIGKGHIRKADGWAQRRFQPAMKEEG